MVADLCASAADPWWVIAGAAVALHGAAVDDARVSALGTPCSSRPRPELKQC